MGVQLPPRPPFINYPLIVFNVVEAFCWGSVAILFRLTLFLIYIDYGSQSAYTFPVHSTIGGFGLRFVDRRLEEDLRRTLSEFCDSALGKSLGSLEVMAVEPGCGTYDLGRPGFIVWETKPFGPRFLGRFRPRQLGKAVVVVTIGTVGTGYLTCRYRTDAVREALEERLQKTALWQSLTYKRD